MSNALAIAAVTAVLKDRLNDGLLNADLGSLGDFSVTSLPPDRFGSGGSDPSPANRLNLFLYRVSPNPGWANERLPYRSGDGQRLAAPYLALDLHYLLSAYGADELNDQILLGYGMLALHEMPVLGRDAVRTSLSGGAVDGAILPPGFQQLVAADLAEQVEQIRISPWYPDLETTSHLWSSLNTGLRPTALYQATVVLIESQTATRTALPVRRANLQTVTLKRPAIQRVLSQPDGETPPVEGAVILPGHRLVLVGNGLQGDVTSVRLGEVVLSEEALELSDQRLAFTLPGDLQAGVHGVQVRHELAKEDSAETIPGEGSNVRAFVLSPAFRTDPLPAFELTDVEHSDPAEPAGPLNATLHVRFAHPVGARQRVRVQLDQHGGSGVRRSYAVATSPLPPGVDEATERTFPLRGVAQLTYLVRVSIDGAESQLEVTNGAYSGPTLEVVV